MWTDSKLFLINSDYLFTTWNFGQVIVSSFLQYEKCVLWFLRLWFWFSLNQTCMEDHELSRSLFPTAAKSLQSCPTLCDPIPGILQARTLEWVAISFSNAQKWKVKVKLLSHVQFFATPWTAAYQAPPSMGYSRQEYWSGVPLLSPRSLFREVWFSASVCHLLWWENSFNCQIGIIHLKTKICVLLI